MGHTIFDSQDECGCNAMVILDSAGCMCNLIESWKTIDAKLEQKGAFLVYLV